ncbi:MAG: IS21 family transposase [Polyangiaceae bacterium]|nr:IS21 family transposase [Polyangiaceae bacterium]
MIPPEKEAEILRLHHAEKWKPGTIAAQLHVHHNVVTRVLMQAGLSEVAATPRASIAAPYVPFIVETLDKYPTLRASRLYDMVRARGYPGQPDHFRAVVARYRPKPPAEAFLRLRTLPGEQAQVDWGHFGKIVVGKATRALMAFVMVLSWSRWVFLRFFLNCNMNSFLRGHVEAFAYFGGVPRVSLYDNLKSAVLERREDAIRFHPTMLDLAKHYCFAPRPVARARGNEKGRVERRIRDVRDSFFAAREYRDLDDLNAQALTWCHDIVGGRRCPEDNSLSVREAFVAEQPRLLALPANPYPSDERLEVHVGKTPYARFDLNDYSVPHTHVRRTLVVYASPTRVRVLDGDEEIANHERSWSRKEQIEDARHIAALVERKRAAREHRGIDRLHAATPSSSSFFERVAQEGGNLGSTTAGLLHLLEAHGAEELEAALSEAVARQTTHLAAVRQILDRRRHERGQPPPIPVQLPDDPRVRNLVVRPHALETYDRLQEGASHDLDSES